MRLPGKVVREIAGRPMLHYIWCAATSCSGLAEVIIATDSEEVLEVCRKHKWNARMTSTAHASGTDRVWEVASQVPADVFINIQGDEPLARQEHIEALLGLMQNPAVQVGTLKTPCAAHDVANPNAVKVVTDNAGRALYFSRATVPFDRDADSHPRYFKHLGFYGYRSAALKQFCSTRPGELERSERLEQLRFLENGIAIHVAETPFDTIGVDTEADLQRVQALLEARSSGR
jgi:3-deoxy-manno-octulosonate cytidylyltransferase (CMP-KDO synthetase)